MGLKNWWFCSWKAETGAKRTKIFWYLGEKVRWTQCRIISDQCRTKIAHTNVYFFFTTFFVNKNTLFITLIECVSCLPSLQQSCLALASDTSLTRKKKRSNHSPFGNFWFQLQPSKKVLPNSETNLSPCIRDWVVEARKGLETLDPLPIEVPRIPSSTR